MWEEQDLAVPDWSRTKLKSLYYIMNNLIRVTINPNNNAIDLNGYITNVLSRFLDGERFNVPRFIWVELAYAMVDGKRSLPYAPYLIHMIERVTGMRFPYDCEHRVYKIKKTHSGFGGSSIAPQYPTGGPIRGSFAAQKDFPQSSKAQRRKKPSRWNRLSKYIKGIFAHYAYAS
jgi:hypothetical protein